jgi:hypothetical protein
MSAQLCGDMFSSLIDLNAIVVDLYAFEDCWIFRLRNLFG